MVCTLLLSSDVGPAQAGSASGREGGETKAVRNPFLKKNR